MKIQIINRKHFSMGDYDSKKPLLPTNSIYIARYPKSINNQFEHFGNPWAHREGTLANFIVPTRTEAIFNYELWLRGHKFRDVEPQRRQWILDRVEALALAGEDCALVCFCRPAQCHGDVLAKLIFERRSQLRNQFRNAMKLLEQAFRENKVELTVPLEVYLRLFAADDVKS